MSFDELFLCSLCLQHIHSLPSRCTDSIPVLASQASWRCAVLCCAVLCCALCRDDCSFFIVPGYYQSALASLYCLQCYHADCTLHICILHHLLFLLIFLLSIFSKPTDLFSLLLWNFFWGGDKNTDPVYIYCPFKYLVRLSVYPFVWVYVCRYACMCVSLTQCISPATPSNV